ncbi:MAG: hypothetical protein ACRED9_09460 [Caulobacteraceae bacterium]
MRKVLISLAAATSLIALSAAGGASAQTSPQAIFGVDRASEAPALEQVQFFLFGGRNYCWYDYGWRGPGFYWCGYAWRRGLGWGGPWGWRGWHGHRGWNGWHGGAWNGHAWREGGNRHWNGAPGRGHWNGDRGHGHGHGYRHDYGH